jgi:hypothetical protein
MRQPPCNQKSRHRRARCRVRLKGAAEVALSAATLGSGGSNAARVARHFHRQPGAKRRAAPINPRCSTAWATSALQRGSRNGSSSTRPCRTPVMHPAQRHDAVGVIAAAVRTWRQVRGRPAAASTSRSASHDLRDRCCRQAARVRDLVHRNSPEPRDRGCVHRAPRASRPDSPAFSTASCAAIASPKRASTHLLLILPFRRIAACHRGSGPPRRRASSAAVGAWGRASRPAACVRQRLRQCRSASGSTLRCTRAGSAPRR